MLKAGISTACLYPQPIEEALYDLALGGVTMVELFINTHSELKRSFVAALSDILHRFEVQCCSLHPFTSEIETMMLFSAYERRLLHSGKIILPLLFYRYAAAGSKYFCSTWQ